MNEKDIRDRITQFLKKTARTVVVPASVGLGLSPSACNSNGLRPVGDAGLGSKVAQTDAAKTGSSQADAAIKYDVPQMMVDAAADEIPSPPPPYGIWIPPVDGAATVVWKLDASLVDADNDARTDARPDLAAQEMGRPETYKDALPDVRADLPWPPPPYLAPPILPDELTGGDSPKSPSKK